MKKLLLFLFLILTLKLFSQEGTDLQLAQYYFSNGEFEKALPYCQKVFVKDNSKYNFKRYYECLLKSNKEKEAEKILKKQINTHKEDFEYSIMLGDFYQSRGDLKEATKLYNDLIAEYATQNFTILELFSGI
jgi:tetratricopeptide (TPR) repeat protein